MAEEQPPEEKRRGEGNPRVIKVLMYHRIVSDERLSHAHWTCVHVRDFRRQLELLDRWGFTTITFDDYNLYLAGELNLPRKPVILTFDDGYRDVYENAFPLLQEYGMRGVVFALGNRLIKTNVWDQAVGLRTAPLMDGQQLLEMHAAGFEIGAHSMSHPKLPALSTEAAWQEITRSRMLLEILLNSPVRSFSYPYGGVNESVKRMVADAGFTIACSVFTGPGTFGMEPYEIRRIAISSNTSTAGFAMRLLMPFQHYGWMRWKVSEVLSSFNGRHMGNGRSM
jgi:peptidoglycan/xylan/chitin deacetylase (PgdA/CDA1 family)